MLSNRLYLRTQTCSITRPDGDAECTFVTLFGRCFRISFLGFLLLAGGLYHTAVAQEVSPIVLVSTTGKVSYLSDGAARKATVVEGAVLKRSGTLQLKKSSQAWLFHDNRYVKLDGKQSRSIADIFPETTNGGSVPLNFDLTFGEYLLSAVYMGAAATESGDGWGGIRTSSKTGDGWGGIRTSSKTGDGWGGIRTSSKTGDGWGGIRTSSKTGDGWGGKGSSITAIQPFGRLLPKVTTLRWSKPQGNPVFKVTIQDEAGQLVAQTTTTDTLWSIDVSVQPFQAGKTYRWQVATEDGANTSNVLPFVVTNEAVFQQALQQSESATLRAANTATELLLQAVALERSDFYEEALQRYQAAQRLKHPGALVNLMHATFWIRYGYPEKADEVWR